MLYVHGILAIFLMFCLITKKKKVKEVKYDLFSCNITLHNITSAYF